MNLKLEKYIVLAVLNLIVITIISYLFLFAIDYQNVNVFRLSSLFIIAIFNYLFIFKTPGFLDDSIYQKKIFILYFLSFQQAFSFSFFGWIFIRTGCGIHGQCIMPKQKIMHSATLWEFILF